MSRVLRAPSPNTARRICEIAGVQFSTFEAFLQGNPIPARARKAIIAAANELGANVTR